MSETKVQRRGFGEDGIYLDAARNRYMGAISVGYGPDGKRILRKVSGKTKQEVDASSSRLPPLGSIRPGRGRTATRSTSGARNGMAATPRPGSPGGLCAAAPLRGGAAPATGTTGARPADGR